MKMSKLRDRVLRQLNAGFWADPDNPPLGYRVIVLRIQPIQYGEDSQAIRWCKHCVEWHIVTRKFWKFWKDGKVQQCRLSNNSNSVKVHLHQRHINPECAELHRVTSLEYMTNKYKNDPKFRAKAITKTRIREKKLEKHSHPLDMNNLIVFRMNQMVGEHIDHLVPIAGKNVSGFNLSINLQILSAKDNQAKYNKFEGTKWQTIAEEETTNDINRFIQHGVWAIAYHAQTNL